MNSFRSIHQVALVATAFALSALPQESRAAATVLAGWDLFETAGGTTFMGVPFVGVPLGSFDFGGSIGVKPTGTTDTIVERMGNSVGPGLTAPVPIELVALQLVSAVPFSFGLEAPALHYLTLQKHRSLLEGGPGPSSTGMITVTVGPEAPAHGTFDSFFDVYFDLRHGSLTGAIDTSGMLTMSSSGSSWGHTAPPGAIIQDVNYLLNGTNNLNDFHPFSVMESHPSGAMHNVQPAQFIPIPFGFSPGMGIALCSALLGVGHLRRKLAARRSEA
jgi:hypothetical protein